jgi:hypothetical protein
MCMDGCPDNGVGVVYHTEGNIQARPSGGHTERFDCPYWLVHLSDHPDTGRNPHPALAFQGNCMTVQGTSEREGCLLSV